jgi:hypothetical protein
MAHARIAASRIARVLSLVAAVATSGIGCNATAVPYLDRLAELRATSAALRLDFVKANDASNRAVMADTNDVSVAFAHDAAESLKAVDRDVAALGPSLKGLGLEREAELLGEFGRRLVAYREVDRRVLELAVENTNLKASRLSFGPVAEAADRLRGALGALSSKVPEKERCKVEGLVATAMLAVREVQVLQAPHIAEADDGAMTRLENDMTRLESKARESLQTLAALAAIDPGASVAATSALAQFERRSAEVVKLSRRNSNVVSLDLSLRTKPALTRACEEALAGLEDALRNEGSKATR